MATVYRLKPHEYDRYTEHLLNLDEENRYLRFGFYAKDDTIVTIAKRWKTNPLDHRIFVIEDSNLDVIAAGHVSKELKPVEIALSVLKSHQRQGLGTLLMDHCIKWCQNRNVETGRMVCLPQNTAIRKIAKRYGIVITEEGESTSDIAIPKPNVVSIWNEYVSNNMATADHIGKANMKMFKQFTSSLRFK